MNAEVSTSTYLATEGMPMPKARELLDLTVIDLLLDIFTYGAEADI